MEGQWMHGLETKILLKHDLEQGLSKVELP